MSCSLMSFEWNPAYKDFMVFVCSFSWILTVMQGFGGFWRFYRYCLSASLREYAKERIKFSDLVGKVDKDKHTITGMDVALLQHFLGEQLVSLFKQDLHESGRKGFTASEQGWFTPDVEKLKITYSIATMVITLYVASLLIIQSGETSCVVWNIVSCVIVTLPLMYMFAWLHQFTKFTYSTLGDLVFGDATDAMHLWENSKNQLSIP